MSDDRDLNDKLREMEGLAARLSNLQEQLDATAASSLGRLSRLRETWNLPGGEEIERHAGQIRRYVEDAHEAMSTVSANVQQTVQQAYEQQQQRARETREQEEQERAARQERERDERDGAENPDGRGDESGDAGGYDGYGGYGDSYGRRDDDHGGNGEDGGSRW